MVNCERSSFLEFVGIKMSILCGVHLNLGIECIWITNTYLYIIAGSSGTVKIG